MTTAPPRPTRIGPGAGKAATRIGAGTTPVEAAPPKVVTSKRIDVPAVVAQVEASAAKTVTGIVGQRRQRTVVTTEAARAALVAAGVALPPVDVLDRAIALFHGIVWPLGQPQRMAEEADRLGQAPQQRLYQLCDAVLALQQSRQPGDLDRHLGRIHELLAAVAERMAGSGVRNAVLDWMGSEILPAATHAELRSLQHEVFRLQAPIDAALAAMARLGVDCEQVATLLGDWGVACHFTSLIDGVDLQPALSRVVHARLESLLRSQALALQQRHIVEQLTEHLRTLRDRAHDAVLTDLPAWLSAVASMRGQVNPTQRYSLRSQLESITERLTH